MSCEELGIQMTKIRPDLACSHQECYVKKKLTFGSLNCSVLGPLCYSSLPSPNQNIGSMRSRISSHLENGFRYFTLMLCRKNSKSILRHPQPKASEREKNHPEFSTEGTSKGRWSQRISRKKKSRLANGEISAVPGRFLLPWILLRQSFHQLFPWKFKSAVLSLLKAKVLF